MNGKIGKIKFYLLSFTWGLPLNIVGLIVALVMRMTGHKSEKWGYCRYFEVGRNWGGCEFGVFFLVQKGGSARLKDHEHGHAIQNCYFGFLMPFAVDFPSSARYWYRAAIQKAKPEKVMKPYDSIWFEGQATRLGGELRNHLITNQTEK